MESFAQQMARARAGANIAAAAAAAAAPAPSQPSPSNLPTTNQIAAAAAAELRKSIGRQTPEQFQKKVLAERSGKDARMPDAPSPPRDLDKNPGTTPPPPPPVMAKGGNVFNTGARSHSFFK